MGVYCCLNCVAPKRHPGCHGHCPEYIEQKAKNDKDREEATRKRLIGSGITSQKIAGVMRANRKKGRR